MSATKAGAIKAGDTVGLVPRARRSFIPGNPMSAIVVRVFKDGSVRLDRPLGGFHWWHIEDLRVLKNLAQPYPQTIQDDPLAPVPGGTHA